MKIKDFISIIATILFFFMFSGCRKESSNQSPGCIHYQYDKSDKIIKIINPNQKKIEINYNDRGQIN